jgi:hypothetical protein
MIAVTSVACLDAAPLALELCPISSEYALKEATVKILEYRDMEPFFI